MFVPLRPICDYLGISWSGQRERTMRDLVLSRQVRFVRLSRTNLGGNPLLLCLSIDFLNGWLFGINASRVKAEHQEKVIRYQTECYRVLRDAFRPAALTSDVSISALEQIRSTALAVAQLAEQQIEMETRLTGRLNKAAEIFIGFDRRLKTLEKQISPATRISDDQAENISATVKALAELMNAKAPGKNHYQGIFSELYRRYGVSSYKNIRLEQYEKVLQFLEDWRQSLQGES